MIRAAVVGALLLLSTPAAAQPDPVGRLLERATALEDRGRGARAWRLRVRALERAADLDVRPALALARALPSEVAEPPGDPWPRRARVVVEALDAALDEDAVDAALPDAADRRQARRLREWASAVAGDVVGAIERASGLAGLQDRATAGALRSMATLAVHGGELHAARAALSAALRAYPQDNGVLADLGVVELALGEPGSAAERFARILGRRPTDLRARRDLAGALVAAGRASAAVELLEQAVAAHPDDPALRVELAYAALEANAPTSAERFARQVLPQLEPEDPRGHVALGAALAAQRRRAEARDAFREALRRAPSDLRAREGLDALEREEPASGPAPGASESLDTP